MDGKILKLSINDISQLQKSRGKGVSFSKYDKRNLNLNISGPIQKKKLKTETNKKNFERMLNQLVLAGSRASPLSSISAKVKWAKNLVRKMPRCPISPQPKLKRTLANQNTVVSGFNLVLYIGVGHMHWLKAFWTCRSLVQSH